MNRHRPSSIRTFRRCPFRGHKEYYTPGHPVKTEPPENFLTGIAFHEFAEKALEAGETGALVGYNAHGRYSARMELECAALWSTGKSLLPSGHIVAIERPIKVAYGHDTEQAGWIAGTPDVEVIPDDTPEDGPNTLTIVDWKTAFAPMGYEEEQFLDYAALAATNTPQIERIRRHTIFVRLHYVVKDEIPKERALEHFQVMIKRCQAIDALDPHDAAAWDATPGHICDDCPAAMECPVPEQAKFAAGAVTTGTRALEMVQEIMAVESKVKNMKAALKGWCSEAGPVNMGDGYQYGFRTIEKKGYDNEAIHEALASDTLMGLFQDGFIKVDGQKLAKLKKEDELAYQAIMQAMTIKPESRFERHKVDPV